MSHFTLYNKLSGPAHFEMGPLPWFDQIPDAGIMFVPAILEERVGTEMTILLIDKTPFIYDLARVRPFNLRLKTGLVRTSHGPLMFLLFYVPDPKNQSSVFAMIDNHINPFDPAMIAPCRDLARQSHWHLILVDSEANVVDLFESDNVYGLGEALDQVVQACASLPHGDFQKAKAEFSLLYTLR